MYKHLVTIIKIYLKVLDIYQKGIPVLDLSEVCNLDYFNLIINILENNGNMIKTLILNSLPKDTGFIKELKIEQLIILDYSFYVKQGLFGGAEKLLSRDYENEKDIYDNINEDDFLNLKSLCVYGWKFENIKDFKNERYFGSGYYYYHDTDNLLCMLHYKDSYNCHCYDYLNNISDSDSEGGDPNNDKIVLFELDIHPEDPNIFIYQDSYQDISQNSNKELDYEMLYCSGLNYCDTCGFKYKKWPDLYDNYYNCNECADYYDYNCVDNDELLNKCDIEDEKLWKSKKYKKLWKSKK